MDPAPRKRGRPPKYPKLANNGSVVSTGKPKIPKSPKAAIAVDDDEKVDLVAGVIRTGKRGRPRKLLGAPTNALSQNGSADGVVAAGKQDNKWLHKNRPLDALSGKHHLRSKSPPPKSPKTLYSAKGDALRHSSHEEHVVQVDDVKDAPFMDAVVKVFCVHTEPNFSLPWQRKRQFSSNSSGFIISGRRVLTNAHSVEHHTQVKVKKRGSDTKHLATVLAIGTECDIAMLTVSDDEFWEGVIPVEFGDLPRLQDAVTVVGYPIGGDTISVTSGVVSRIEVTSYVHGSTELLGVQIDAAINSGNSGGPAFNDRGQCVGIAFQSLKHEDAENIGYVIPTPVINHFISDYEQTGDYTEWQKMENPDLRKAVGMEPSQKGVRIRRVEPTAPAAKSLLSGDIILSFDGIDIANDGTVPFRLGERIGFSYLVSKKFTGEQAKINILRDRSLEKFDIKLATHKRLVPVHIKGKPPSYYIVAGIVFTAVSVPYLRSELIGVKFLTLSRRKELFTNTPLFGGQYGKDYDFDAPVKLLDKLLHSMAQTENEQLVVVSQVLVADINIGYEEIVNTQVLAFNGTPIQNLKHLATMVESCEDEFLRFELEYQQVVVLETKTAKAATHEILATHCIPSAVSNDLKN
ncbi:hypothetical protein O6H91_06G025500 [Diphasiastrum complanatum]|uniref:Uncharacterized protein n=2 Tax=Diphasiastrum complanatum TaxID=34168 RepID=A0ACC2DBS9_DIPCM|nr:hypothetical protein O6H91_06G025500 [Diphasiastrum complanatum]KAJ7551711.1 hypothetical protein O6H91_06G025500 [Diphasiastrum complanatum]